MIRMIFQYILIIYLSCITQKIYSLNDFTVETSINSNMDTDFQDSTYNTMIKEFNNREASLIAEVKFYKENMEQLIRIRNLENELAELKSRIDPEIGRRNQNKMLQRAHVYIKSEIKTHFSVILQKWKDSRKNMSLMEQKFNQQSIITYQLMFPSNAYAEVIDAPYNLRKRDINFNINLIDSGDSTIEKYNILCNVLGYPLSADGKDLKYYATYDSEAGLVFVD